MPKDLTGDSNFTTGCLLLPSPFFFSRRRKRKKEETSVRPGVGEEQQIHCQPLVWITLVFSLVLPLVLGLDAWVFSLHLQVSRLIWRWRKRRRLGPSYPGGEGERRVDLQGVRLAGTADFSLEDFVCSCQWSHLWFRRLIPEEILQITVYNQEWLTIDHQGTNLPRSIQDSMDNSSIFFLLEKKKMKEERTMKARKRRMMFLARPKQDMKKE